MCIVIIICIMVITFLWKELKSFAETSFETAILCTQKGYLFMEYMLIGQNVLNQITHVYLKKKDELTFLHVIYILWEYIFIFSWICQNPQNDKNYKSVIHVHGRSYIQ